MLGALLTKKSARFALLFLALQFIYACASAPENAEATSVEPSITLGNIEFHTAELAQELFAGLNANQQYRYAVVGFVPVSSLRSDLSQQHPLMLLGHQLEQGLMTEAHRWGLVTQDYKVTNSIILQEQAESVMSRNSELLSATINADFYISGTITEQQEGAIVNARVIHVKSRDVVAAATKFFPGGLFWEREQTSSRNGMIYRTSSQ